MAQGVGIDQQIRIMQHEGSPRSEINKVRTNYIMRGFPSATCFDPGSGKTQDIR